LLNVFENLSGRKKSYATPAARKNAYRTPQNLSANIDNPNTTAKKSPGGIESTKDSNSLMLHLLDATAASSLPSRLVARRSDAHDIL
jgi:hypothetical protein